MKLLRIVLQGSKDSLKTNFGTLYVSSNVGFDQKLLEKFNERPDDVLLRFGINRISFHGFRYLRILDSLFATHHVSTGPPKSIL